MSPREPVSVGTVALFVLLVICVSIPIFSVERFVNQDGSSHAYSASIMLDLMINGKKPDVPVGLNPVPVPNSSGHWLLVLLLTCFSVFTTTKLILVLIYAGFVSSVAWMRWAAFGSEDLNLNVLMGGVVGLNWLWLVGTYSFLLGSILMFGVFGLFVYWGARLNWKRTLLLACLLMAVYFTHLIGFTLLIGMMVLHSVIIDGEKAFKTVGQVIIALLPTVPLLIAYRSLSEAGGAVTVAWRLADKGFSMPALAEHFRSMDPFSLISRRALPMVEQTLAWYGLASPVIWIVIAFAIAVASTLILRSANEPRQRVATSLLTLFGIFTTIAVFAPDEIGLHGGVIRPRFFVLALALFAAAFRFRNYFGAQRFVTAILALVFIFQVTALYDYANRSNATAGSFLSAGQVIQAGDHVASIVIVEASPRSISHPEIQLSSILGTVNHIFVWDNYEFGYYQFPVFVADRADREFALKLNFAKVYESGIVDDKLAQKLATLNQILAANPEKIDKLLLWGRDERIEAILAKFFDMQPLFETERIRVFQNSRKFAKAGDSDYH